MEPNKIIEVSIEEIEFLKASNKKMKLMLKIINDAGYIANMPSFISTLEKNLDINLFYGDDDDADEDEDIC